MAFQRKLASSSSRTSIGTALLCFQSIRLYSTTVIRVSTKYKRLPCDYQFSWLGSKSAVQCCVETPRAGNPPSGFEQSAGPSPLTESACSVSLFVRPRPPAFVKESRRTFSLTATRTPPHIFLITSGAMPIWTIEGEERRKGGNQPQPTEAQVTASDGLCNALQQYWSHTEQFTVQLYLSYEATRDPEWLSHVLSALGSGNQ